MEVVSNKFKILRIRVGITRDLFVFLWDHKLWWAIPIILILITISSLLVVAGHTGLAAFIYPLF